MQTPKQTSANWLQAAITSAKLAAILAVTLVASGCATPTGAAFTTAEAVPTGQAQVYLYRKWALQASGLDASVKLNAQEMGALGNGTYLRVTVAPGKHVLSVKPGAFSSSYDAVFELTNGQTQYVEFVVPPFILTTALMLGSDISPRTPERAVVDMQGLKGMK